MLLWYISAGQSRRRMDSSRADLAFEKAVGKVAKMPCNGAHTSDTTHERLKNKEEATDA